MSTTDFTIYGASDDLIEIEASDGRADEYDCYDERGHISLTSPDGDRLDVFLSYGPSVMRHADTSMEWTIAVAALHGYPSWPVRFTERPDREGDPAVIITAPEGTTFKYLGGEGQ